MHSTTIRNTLVTSQLKLYAKAYLEIGNMLLTTFPVLSKLIDILFKRSIVMSSHFMVSLFTYKKLPLGYVTEE